MADITIVSFVKVLKENKFVNNLKPMFIIHVCFMFIQIICTKMCALKRVWNTSDQLNPFSGTHCIFCFSSFRRPFSKFSYATAWFYCDEVFICINFPPGICGISFIEPATTVSREPGGNRKGGRIIQTPPPLKCCVYWTYRKMEAVKFT